jgi:hypothetical protein
MAETTLYVFRKTAKQPPVLDDKNSRWLGSAQGVRIGHVRPEI